MTIAGRMMEEIYAGGVYFLADSGTFSYTATCLADGLSFLGVPIRSNIDYHDPLISSFSFTRTDEPQAVREAFCVLADLQDTVPYNNRVVTLERVHDRMLAMCMQDNVAGMHVEGIDAFFCAHESTLRQVAGPRVPITFGLSSSMISATMDVRPGMPRNQVFLRNFRPSLSQELRACLDLVLLPHLKTRFAISDRTAGNGRWNAEYYQLLKQNLGCLAYGGYFDQDLSLNDYFMKNGNYRSIAERVQYRESTVVLRWDSWRLWESLLCGCITLHLDFERYGFKLPVMPVNWHHYVGIDLADVKRDVERLMDERERLPEIGWNGRQWAIEQYSPVAVARRFIRLLQEIYQGK